MTGMKEGAGEDPFSDDSQADEDEELVDSRESDRTTTSSSVAESARETTEDRERSRSTTSTRNGSQSMQIPYKFRRDSVQTGRTRVPLFLQDETQASERETLRAIEDRFNDDVSTTDLREALVRVGMRHLDEVEEELETWGYGMTFED